MRYLFTIMIPAVLFLSGCAKMMNENQCLAADWRSVGYEDGSAGRNEQWLAKRSEACAEYGVTPDMDQYLFGRAQGLEAFCQPRRGFDLGSRGNRYENVCPANLEPAFLNAFQDGRGLRDRRAIFNDLERAVSAAYADLKTLDKEIAANTLTLATSTDMTNQERIDYALDLKNMAEERGRIQSDLPKMEADLEAAQYDLDMYVASIAPKYPGSL